MWGFFQQKKNRFIGVDFGTSAIKVVELSYDKKNAKAVLENYGWFDMMGVSQDSGNQTKLVYEDKLRSALVNLLHEMNIENEEVNVAIPGFSGLVIMIEFPKMKANEIAQAIEFEAHRYIPTPIENVSLSWEIVDREGASEENKKNSSGRLNILLVAAPKKEIEKYSSLLKDTGPKMSSIELETFSITRALIGRRKGNYLIMDIGSRATNMVLVENGIVVINRSVDMGGDDITNTIADNLNVSKQRAESFKKEGKDFINDNEAPILIPVLEFLTGEAKRIMAAYKEKNENGELDGFILSGGSSALGGIEKYFEDALGVDVIIGNPWEGIQYDERLEASIKRIGSSFSVAIGLALRGIEDEFSSN